MDKDNRCSITPRVLRAYMNRVTGPSFEKLGITATSAPFLVAIRSNEGISLKGLTEHLMVDKAHTTRMISKLNEAGLVENRAQGHEYSLFLTESGKRMADESVTIFETAWHSLFRDLTEDERKALDTIIRKVSNVIEEAIQ